MNIKVTISPDFLHKVLHRSGDSFSDTGRKSDAWCDEMSKELQAYTGVPSLVVRDHISSQLRWTLEVLPSYDGKLHNAARSFVLWHTSDHAIEDWLDTREESI